MSESPAMRAALEAIERLNRKRFRPPAPKPVEDDPALEAFAMELLGDLAAAIERRTGKDEANPKPDMPSKEAA